VDLAGALEAVEAGALPAVEVGLGAIGESWWWWVVDEVDGGRKRCETLYTDALVCSCVRFRAFVALGFHSRYGGWIQGIGVGIT
jgi:hypothetical protein